MPPSGHVFMCGPLSVEYTTTVFSARPFSSRKSSTEPTSSSWSTIVSWYSDCQRPALPRLPSLTWVRKCMCVVLSQTKNGVPLASASVMNRSASGTTSSSIVFIRSLVSGPVSSMRWVPSGSAHAWMTPRGPKFFRKSGNSSSLG